MRIDLHMHSTCSDGTFAPGRVIEEAAAAGMSLVALTDHDSCAGVQEAAARAEALGLDFLPGIELSCGGEQEIHVLGYGIDPGDLGLRRFQEERLEERIRRGEAMMDALDRIGVKVDREYVKSISGSLLARPHIARAIARTGLVHTAEEAFRLYLLPGRPAYVARQFIPVETGCNLIQQAGGIPVLAHPMQLRMGERALEIQLHEWHAQGLAGLEVYHPSTANQKAVWLHRLAEQEGLIITAGSDFHGPEVRDTCIGQGTERFADQEEHLVRLYEAMGRPMPKCLAK